MYPTTTHGTHACAHRLHRLVPTGHEGRRTKGGTLCPCHHHISPSSSPPTFLLCNSDQGSSPLSSKETFPRVCLAERGSWMHSHSHLSTPGPALLLSIDAWTHGCSRSERVSSRRLGYYVAPHLRPWKRRGNKKPCTINMIEYWLHSASRNRPPLLTLGKPRRLKLLFSFFLGPG